MVAHGRRDISLNQEQVAEKKALPSGKDNFCHRFVLLFLTVKWHTRVWPDPTPLLIPLILPTKVVEGCYSMTFPNYCLTVFGQKFSFQLAFVSEI